MCGIFGYTGQKEAQGLIIQGLKHLEYRGYDSSGIAMQNGNHAIHVLKTKGKIRNLEDAFKDTGVITRSEASPAWINSCVWPLHN